MPSIKAQIEWLATPGSGALECDAIELTTEDLLKWGKDKPVEEKCKVKIQGPIVKRTRGMLAPRDKACVITGLNALYHKFTTENATDNAAALYKQHFPSTPCPEGDKRDNLKIDVDTLAGAFGLVALVLMYGTVHHFCGKGMREIEFCKLLYNCN